jgi:hypothetical protein
MRIASCRPSSRSLAASCCASSWAGEIVVAHLAAARTYSAGRKPDLERTERLPRGLLSRLLSVGQRSHLPSQSALCLFVAARCKFVLDVLNVVVGIVLNGRLRRLVPRRQLADLAFFLLVPLKIAATMTSNAAPPNR